MACRVHERRAGKPSGAARRCIWLLNLLVCHPEKVQSGMDLLVWGKGEELVALGKQVEAGSGR